MVKKEEGKSIKSFQFGIHLLNNTRQKLVLVGYFHKQGNHM